MTFTIVLIGLVTLSLTWNVFLHFETRRLDKAVRNSAIVILDLMNSMNHNIEATELLLKCVDELNDNTTHNLKELQKEIAMKGIEHRQ